MRLLLSSYRLGARVHELAELAGAPARIAVVANALDNLPDHPRDSWLHEEYSALTGAGLAWHELDLRGYYGQPHKLRPALAQVDMIWATGGNVFVLRDAMRRSGLDLLLVDRLSADSLAYGGYSTGACVCGPTMRGLELVDEIGAVPEPVWDGLGFVDFSIAPHCRPDNPEAGCDRTHGGVLPQRTRCPTGRSRTGRRSSSVTGPCEPWRCNAQTLAPRGPLHGARADWSTSGRCNTSASGGQCRFECR